MELEWLNIDGDEKVQWSGSPRIQSIIPAVVIGIPFSVVGIGILIIAGAYLNVKNTEFVVTNHAVYRKSGILSRSVKKIDLGKIQNISYSQDALGNYFGYGNVEISTAGGSGVEMSFRSIEEPQKVQELIGQLSKEPSEAEESHDGPSEREILLKMLEELQEIRKDLDRL
jgi:uncharacterized membrane protein YdbT with pleckstrin-like domain